MMSIDEGNQTDDFTDVDVLVGGNVDVSTIPEMKITLSENVSSRLASGTLGDICRKTLWPLGTIIIVLQDPELRTIGQEIDDISNVEVSSRRSCQFRHVHLFTLSLTYRYTTFSFPIPSLYRVLSTS